MRQTLILSLILLCKVFSPSEREVQFADELQRAGVEIDAGPWDINDEKSLMDPESGMYNYRAVWSWCDKDGKAWYDKDRIFIFDNVDEVQDLVHKLLHGKAMFRAYLVLYKDFEPFLRPGNTKASILYLDPRGFFFSVIETIQSLRDSFWTLDKAFYQASESPEKMVEFQKQLEESERKKREQVSPEQAPGKNTPLVKEFKQEQEKMFEIISELQEKLAVSEQKREKAQKKQYEFIKERLDSMYLELREKLEASDGLQKKLEASERKRQEEQEKQEKVLENMHKEAGNREAEAARRREEAMRIREERNQEQIKMSQNIHELQKKLEASERERQEGREKQAELLQRMCEETAKRELVREETSRLREEATQEIRRDAAQRRATTQITSAKILELQERLEILEQEKYEAVRREQLILEEAEKREENLLKKMEEMSKLITEGPRVMMQSFMRHNLTQQISIQQNFMRQASELLSSHGGSVQGDSSEANSPSASLPDLDFRNGTLEIVDRRVDRPESSPASTRQEIIRREAIMDRLIEENSQLIKQDFAQQVHEINENLDELKYRLQCIFAPDHTPAEPRSPVGAAAMDEPAHEVASDWSRRLEEVATPAPSEARSPAGVASARQSEASSGWLVP